SGSFRESMSSLFRRNGSPGHSASNPIPNTPSHPESNPIPKDFWALQDINFEIKRGEAVGIIGRNGAGKSTLLKILSRITEPTTGRYEIFGRVSSLLEVGTGFHPELTGRENVYLNGTILGMKRREVKAKFDEIVAFSGVEKFIDTPVKHYSSGMQVRLAFAVAAHLEPEILIIDEVLAVGDAEFQKKCLGKMEDVTGEGRTVLFVSHNMGAVRRLCGRGIVVDEGEIVFIGEASDAINNYLLSNKVSFSNKGVIEWKVDQAPQSEEVYFRSITLYDGHEIAKGTFLTDEEIRISIEYVIRKKIRGSRLVVQILDNGDNVVFASSNQDSEKSQIKHEGIYQTICRIPSNFLNESLYKVKIQMGIPGIKVLIKGEPFLSFNTILSGNNGSIYKEKWPGLVAPKLIWRTEHLTEIV
ncbi:MAG: ABC transporter ATP-binding protein, partial [Parerythrobacter sp.]